MKMINPYQLTAVSPIMGEKIPQSGIEGVINEIPLVRE